MLSVFAGGALENQRSPVGKGSSSSHRYRHSPLEDCSGWHVWRTETNQTRTFSSCQDEIITQTTSLRQQMLIEFLQQTQLIQTHGSLECSKIFVPPVFVTLLEECWRPLTMLNKLLSSLSFHQSLHNIFHVDLFFQTLACASSAYTSPQNPPQLSFSKSQLLLPDYQSLFTSKRCFWRAHSIVVCNACDSSTVRICDWPPDSQSLGRSTLFLFELRCSPQLRYLLSPQFSLLSISNLLRLFGFE
eukprot:TRINITY_DN120_c0_g1_i1.p1 TRINITY_DN120_c0_g1~~TRINITY_DN120_c0_g1_i1.p1  ORF type:complete len:244 (-),score=40.29 TRINITY_DN120_c0_g1_i1:273-1004(-)